MRGSILVWVVALIVLLVLLALVLLLRRRPTNGSGPVLPAAGHRAGDPPAAPEVHASFGITSADVMAAAARASAVATRRHARAEVPASSQAHDRHVVAGPGLVPGGTSAAASPPAVASSSSPGWDPGVVTSDVATPPAETGGRHGLPDPGHTTGYPSPGSDDTSR